MYDMSNLTKFKLLDENSPEAMKAFWALIKPHLLLEPSTL